MPERKRSARRMAAAKTDGIGPIQKPADLQAMVRAEAQMRADRCTKEVFAALEPILTKHKCRIGTRQMVIDGRPGAVEIICLTID